MFRFFSSLFIFLLCFFVIPSTVFAAPQVVGELQYEGYYDALLNINVDNPDTEASLIIVHMRLMVSPSTCNFVSAPTLDGSSLASRQMNTSDHTDGSDYYIYWSSVLDGNHVIGIDMNLGTACPYRLNVFALSGVDYSRVPDIVALDRGSNWGSQTLSAIISSSSMSEVGQRGLGVDVMGSYLTAPTTFSAGTGEIIISNPASSSAAIGAQMTPTDGYGSYTMSFSSDNLTGYHYFFWVPLIASSSPSQPPEVDDLNPFPGYTYIESAFCSTLGNFGSGSTCQLQAWADSTNLDAGNYLAFYANQDNDTCHGNEYSSSSKTFLFFNHGLGGSGIYIPPSNISTVKDYCLARFENGFKVATTSITVTYLADIYMSDDATTSFATSSYLNNPVSGPLTNIINTLTVMILNVFPFNVFYDVLFAWNSSADQPLAGTTFEPLYFFDDNGDLSFFIPFTESTTTIPVFSTFDEIDTPQSRYHLFIQAAWMLTLLIIFKNRILSLIYAFIHWLKTL